MERRIRADLHIHTCLSPCGDLAMSPKRIVGEATRKGLDMIGVCDHNTAENVPAVEKAAEGSGLTVLPGIEVMTCEEAHILGIFESLDAAMDLQMEIYDHLAGENDPEAFGMQPVVNEDGEVLEFNSRLLLGATTLSVENVVERIHDRRGLAVASQVDRESFSLVGQLGFVPIGLELDALEITHRTPYAEARRKYDRHGRYEIIRGSDAHYPQDIGAGSFEFTAEAPTLEELRFALHAREGRRVIHDE